MVNLQSFTQNMGIINESSQNVCMGKVPHIWRVEFHTIDPPQILFKN